MAETESRTEPEAPVAEVIRCAREFDRLLGTKPLGEEMDWPATVKASRELHAALLAFDAEAAEPLTPRSGR